MLRLSERIRAVEQGRAADGKELFGEKALHSQSRPAVASVTDSDVGMPLAEFADSRDQPFGGEGGQHADHQHTAAVGARCLSGGVVEWNERSSQRRRLAEVGPRMLKDIGISRVDVWQEVNKPFWSP